MQVFTGQARINIAIVAGEASGDGLGAGLIAQLKQRYPQAEFAGIGGPKMQAQGLRSVVPMSRLAVRGYLEVVRHLPGLLRLRRQLRAALLREKPDVLIGIDAPDFNLGLETACRRAGIRTVHYVSPSLWAWRPQRIKDMKRAADHVLLLFPFEQKIYAEAGIAATYVGHPMADRIALHTDRALVREELRLPEHRPIFAMLPGSRASELHYHADLYVATMAEVLKSCPEAFFLVPLVTRETRQQFEQALRRHPEAHDWAVRLQFGHADKAMAAADAVLVASGTATLECALIKRPMVITYKLSKLSYWMMRRQSLLPYVGLPNILAGKTLAPELLQDAATPQALAQALLAQYGNGQPDPTWLDTLTEMHATLRQDCSARAAQAIASVLRHG